MTRYVPILKGRQGEFNGLSDVQLKTKPGLLPLLELVPADPSDVDSVKDACRKGVDKLARFWAGPILLDTGLFDLSLDLYGSSRGPLWEAAEHARAVGLHAVPVLHLGDPILARTDTAAACAVDNTGLCLRLSDEDMSEDADDVNEAIDALLLEVGVVPADTDLVLDGSFVDGDLDVKRTTIAIRGLLRQLDHIDEWRSITVASGAFPEDLSGFQAWHVGRRPRFDAALYDRVLSKSLPRIPDYGDYAIAHPAFQAGGAFPPPPQLRYTVAEDWLVLKGSRNDPRSNAQFYDVCDQIATHPEFAGSGLGNADARIADPRAHGVGNGTTWRQIGTTHHLDLVATRLATLGEP